MGGGHPGVDGVDVRAGCRCRRSRAEAIRSASAVWSSQQPRCTQISCARQPRQPGRPVEVDRLRLLEEGVPRPQHHAGRPRRARRRPCPGVGPIGPPYPARRAAGVRPAIGAWHAPRPPRQPASPPRGEARVKHAGRPADRRTVTERAAGDRRAASAPRAHPPAGLLPPAGCPRCAPGSTGRWPRTTTASPTGCGTCATACCSARSPPVAVVGYVLLTDSPGRHHPVHPRRSPALVIAGRARRCCCCRWPTMMRDSPRPDAVLRLEHRDDRRRHRRRPGWTAARPARWTRCCSSRSTYMAVAYSPYGVVAMGSADDRQLPRLRRAART